MNRSVFIILLGLQIITSAVNGQDTNEIINAFKESYSLESKGEYNKAGEVLKKVYKQESYEINLRLGWLSYQAGLFSESMGYYNRSITLMPYSIEPRLGVVLPASALGKWDQVINEYQKILDIDPQNTLVNYRMGLINYERANYAKAEQYFEKVINLYPFDNSSLLMMAWTKLKLLKTREAGVLFQKVLMYNPEDESAKEGLRYIK